MRKSIVLLLKELSCFVKSSSNRPLLFVASHSRGQCFNFQSLSFFFFQFLKALKRGCVLSLSNQMVIITLVLFYGFVNKRRYES